MLIDRLYPGTYAEKNFGGFRGLVESYFDLEEVGAARDEFDLNRVFGPAPWEI